MGIKSVRNHLTQKRFLTPFFSYSLPCSESFELHLWLHLQWSQSSVWANKSIEFNECFWIFCLHAYWNCTDWL